MGDPGVDVWKLFEPWVEHLLGKREKIVVAMDWTDFDADNQTTLALHLVTGHGRATPLIWLSVDRDELKNRRNDFEDPCLTLLKACLPEGVAVTILADRGFGDVKPFAFLQSLGFDYAIRFRDNIQASAQTGETRTAAEWVDAGGRARMLRDVELTAATRSVPAVVCVHGKGMKKPWCIAASNRDGSAHEIVNHYAKMWNIEPHFRDEKDCVEASAFDRAPSSLVSRISQESGRMQEVVHDDQPHCVDLKIAPAAAEGDGIALADHLVADPDHRLALGWDWPCPA